MIGAAGSILPVLLLRSYCYGIDLTMNGMSSKMTNDERFQVLDTSLGRPTMLKIETAEGPAVVKRYLNKRSLYRQGVAQIGSWVFVGKSPVHPRGRMHTETECLALWRKHGFDVFRLLDAKVPFEVPDPHLVFRYYPGRTLYSILEDGAVPETEKLALLEKFSSTWGRRQKSALELMEPRLLHEHGSFRHVFASGDRLFTFDFEIAWVRRSFTPYLLVREVGAFLRSLGRASWPGKFDPRLRAVVRAYPYPDLLRTTVRRALRSPNPLRRGIYLGQKFKRLGDPYAPDQIFKWLDRLLS